MKRKLFSLSCCLVLILIGVFTSCQQEVPESKPEMVTVSYVSEFGTLDKSEKIVEKGYKLTSQDLPALKETGYSFDKWYINKEEAKVGTVINKDIVLVANWTDIAPQPVTNLTAVPGDGKVTLSWTNPADKDLNRIVITSEPKVTIAPLENAKENEQMSTEITGLTNGTKYTFTVKAVDIENNNSSDTYCSCSPDTKKEILGLKVLPKGTDGTFGTNGKYVKFGIWPQTKLADESIITDKNSTVKVNGWDCYTDGKGGYYVKVKATPHSLVKEYTSGKDYFFKLEPIVWCVLTEDYLIPDGSNKYKPSGRKLLLAEKALVNCAYFPYTSSYVTRTISGEGTVYNNNYKHSEVRAFLNGYNYVNPDNSTNITHNGKGFLQKAFTLEQIKAIADTVVDNSAASTTDAGNNITIAAKYACANTTDKIFLLSEKEITTADYGFDAYDKCVGDGTTTTSTRQRTPTDYAKATGIYVNSDYGGNSWWWLRSSGYNSSNYARYVDYDGSAYRSNSVDFTYKGVVPALSISF